MKYYKLLQDISDDYGIASDLRLPIIKEGYEASFKYGEKIDTDIPNPLRIDLKGLKGKRPRHYIEGHNIIIVSTLMLEAFKKAGIDNYQIFPVVLSDVKTKNTWDDYFAFNEIGVIDAALLKESEYDVISEEENGVPPVYGFIRVVLDTKKIKRNQKMFRLAQSPADQLYISEDVFDVLKKMSPPEKWGCQCKNTEVK
jgi:hypothetical protein